MRITTLTPAVKRVIVMHDERPRYGTTRMREADGSIKPVYVPEPREPNLPGPWSVVDDSLKGRRPEPRPFDLLRSSPTRPRPVFSEYREASGLGRRIYDARIDAYVAPPKPPVDFDDRQPKPSIQARSEGGDPYWIYDRSTGARMRRIHASSAASAQQIAAEYALNHGLAASDAYAKKED